MKIPKKVKILGKRYRIDTVPNSNLDPRNQGHILHTTGRITLLDGMAPDATRETLLHECIHSIVDNLQLGLEEKQVGALSAGLYALAKESPRQVRWMLGL